MTELSAFADRTLRNIALVPDEELFKDIDGAAAADITEDERSTWGRSCALEESMILERKTESAAPQSIKTMETHFHNFILKWLRALALCKKKNNKEGFVSMHQNRFSLFFFDKHDL